MHACAPFLASRLAVAALRARRFRLPARRGPRASQRRAAAAEAPYNRMSDFDERDASDDEPELNEEEVLEQCPNHTSRRFSMACTPSTRRLHETRSWLFFFPILSSGLTG